MISKLRGGMSLALVVGMLSGGVVRGQTSDVRLEKVFSAWRQRFDAVKTVSYRAKGEQRLRIGAAGGMDEKPAAQPNVPVKEVVCHVKRSLLLDLEHNRYRLEIEDQQYNSLSNTTATEAYLHLFDGKHLYAVRPLGFQESATRPSGEPKPDVGVVTGDFRQMGLESIHWPMFMGHGIMPISGEKAVPGQLAPQQDREMFYVHGEGVHAGRPCLVLRTYPREAASPTFDECWVDPARQYAIVRLTQYGRGKIYCDIDLQYQQTQGVWLPKGWIFTLFNIVTGGVIKTERLQVQDLQVSPAVKAEDFEVEIKPGMRVSRLQLSPPPSPGGAPKTETTSYRVNQFGGWDEVAYVNGSEQPRWFGGWWVAILVSVVLAGGVWYVARSRLAKACPKPPQM